MREYSTKNSRKAKRKRWKRFFLGTTFRLILIGLILLFSTMYIIETSSIAASGYKISSLKQKIEKLENKNQRLKVKIARKSSINSITDRIDQEEYVPIKNAEYISLEGTSVVKK